MRTPARQYSGTLTLLIEDKIFRLRFPMNLGVPYSGDTRRQVRRWKDPCHPRNHPWYCCAAPMMVTSLRSKRTVVVVATAEDLLSNNINLQAHD